MNYTENRARNLSSIVVSAALICQSLTVLISTYIACAGRSTECCNVIEEKLQHAG